MYGDFMIGSTDVNDVVFSDVTMALFEDSGWYKVNYEYTTSMIWGKDQGCDFIEELCVEDSNIKFKEFCNTPLSERKLRCDYKHLNKGFCYLVEY